MNLENRQILQTGNTIKMCLASSQQSTTGHTALHQFIINRAKTDLVRNSPLLGSLGTFTYVFRWVPQTDRHIVLTRGISVLPFLPPLVLAIPGNSMKAFLQRVCPATCAFTRAILRYTVGWLQKWKCMFNSSLSKTAVYLSKPEYL